MLDRVCNPPDHVTNGKHRRQPPIPHFDADYRRLSAWVEHPKPPHGFSVGIPQTHFQTARSILKSLNPLDLGTKVATLAAKGYGDFDSPCGFIGLNKVVIRGVTALRRLSRRLIATCVCQKTKTMTSYAVGIEVVRQRVIRISAGRLGTFYFSFSDDC